MSKLTIKQQRFIDFYDGNATEAARKAGYKHPNIQSARLLVNVSILTAIKKREEKRNKSVIATREERQAFWTKVLYDKVSKMSDRLKASELLGRSEADFTDNQRISGPDGKDLKWKVEIVDPELDKL